MENIRALPHKWPVQEIVISLVIAAAIIAASACFGYQAESASVENIEFTLTHISARDIFLNNVSMLGLNLLGALLLGIPNLISGMMNGCSIGSFIAIGESSFGMGWVARSLLPHAWLEFPVILLAVSFGVLPWILIASGLRSTRVERRNRLMSVCRYLLIAAFICALLLIPAALIESRISMNI